MPPLFAVRPLEEVDLPEAAAVFLTTLGDLTRRNGLPPPSWAPSMMVSRFRHLRENGDFWVAEHDGRIVSICSASMRDQTWFLSLFWTLPEVQGQGIGGPLLRHVYTLGRERGAVRAFTWSSIDPTAIATYLKFGMLPLAQIFTFAGPLTRPPEIPGDVGVEEAGDEIPALDRELRWVSREADHRWWLASGARAFLVRRGGRTIGWFYVQEGAIGPGGWTDPDDGPAVMAVALREAARGSAKVQLPVVGLNHTAIRAALGGGLRLMGTAHLLQSEAIAAVDRYLPSGPMLF